MNFNNILFILVIISSSSLCLGLYDRSNTKNKPVVRFLQPCGNKFTIKRPYRVISIEETRNFTNNLPVKSDYKYYFYNYYFNNCDLDFLCFEELIRASDRNNHKLVNYFLANGTSFWLPVWDKNPNSWFVAQLYDVFKKYNITSTKGYKFIHEADETLDYANENLIEFYKIWDKSYRVYWWDIPEYTQLHKDGQLDWIPSRFLHSPEVPFAQQNKSSSRSFNITFIGNTNTNKKRALHVNEFEYKMNLSVHGLVKNTGGLYGVNFMGGTVYLDTMLDSRFCLQFRGRSSECHRLYESMECGCIPVIIDNWQIFDYSRQHHITLEVIGRTFPFKNSTKPPFIWVQNVDEFKEIYNGFMSTAQGMKRLDQLQNDLMTWWEATRVSIQQYFKDEFCTKPPLSEGLSELEKYLVNQSPPQVAATPPAATTTPVTATAAAAPPPPTAATTTAAAPVTESITERMIRLNEEKKNGVPAAPVLEFITENQMGGIEEKKKRDGAGA